MDRECIYTYAAAAACVAAVWVLGVIFGLGLAISIGRGGME